ncbi:MAG: RNA polymerase sigma factor [Planctomycetaceae bacterium]|jgi:RNA polymerase sigma-70 factor (ECF subfamily)|nr:RNA polymerase sigma factor [Planctomycetaceae bacterium]
MNRSANTISAGEIRVNKMTALTTDCQYATWDDEELLAEYRYNKNREAFSQLVIRYESELYNYLYRYLGNSANAEDVFQTAFIRIIEHIDTFSEGKRFRPWMYQVAVNCAKDFLTQRKRFSVVSIDDDYGQGGEAVTIAETIEGREQQPAENVVSEDEAQRVRQAVAKLPEEMRQALYLVYFQGLTYSEAAESLGIVKGTMPSRLKNAVAKLNYILKGNEKT